MLDDREVRLLLAALRDISLTPGQASEILEKIVDNPAQPLTEPSSEIVPQDRPVTASYFPQTEQVDDHQKSGIARTSAWTPTDVPVTTPHILVPGASTAGDQERAHLPGQNEQWLDSPASFAVESEIASGGLGRILLARDEYLGRQVAIKEVLPKRADSPDLVRRFFQEARVTGQLEHPGIVPVYSLGIQQDGKPFYVMKLVKGTTYAEAIDSYHRQRSSKRDLSLDFDRLLRNFVDICQAVAFAHSRGVLHRDLKPQNVMLGDFGETIVVDWGLAKILANPENDVPDDGGIESTSGVQTHAGIILGTPAYMSPEQAMGSLDRLDQRSDVFALGSILYEVLVGFPPFQGRDKQEILSKCRSGIFTAPRIIDPKIPPALDAVCRKALAWQPQDRYPDAKSLAEEIIRWQAGETVAAYREPLPMRIFRWMRRHRSLVYGASAAVLSMIALVTAFGMLERWSDQRRDIEIAGLLQEGQREIVSRNWQVARDPLVRAMTLAKEDSSHKLRLAEAESLLESVDQQLAILRDKRKAAEDFNRFQDLQTTVLFHQSFPRDTDEQDLRETALRALRVFGIADPTSSLTIDDSLYGVDESQQIRTGCRELCFLVATAGSQAASGRPPEEEIERSLRWLDLAESLGPPLKSYYLARARLLGLLGMAKEAAEATRAAECTEPAEASDFFLLAEGSYAQQEFESAKDWLQAALQIDPSRFSALYLLCACDLQLGHWEESIRGLTACAGLRPEFLGTYLLRGYAWGELGDLAAAERDFSTAERIAPREPALFNNRGIVRLRNGHFDKAIDDFRAAIQWMPESPVGHINLAEAYRAQGDLPQALSALERAIELAPNQATAYRSRGRILIDTLQLDEATRDLRRAISLEQNRRFRAKDHTELGKVLQRRNDLEGALAEYEAAIATYPESSEAHLLMGIALVDRGEVRLAMDALDRYEELTSEATKRPNAQESESTQNAARSAFHRERSLLRMAVGTDIWGAFTDSILATKLDPDSTKHSQPSDRNRIAILQSRRGWSLLGPTAWRMALDDFDAAAKNPRADGEPFAGRGYAKALLGDYRAAIEDAEKALSLGPRNPEHLFNIACIYSQASARAQTDPAEVEPTKRSAEYAERADRLLRESLELTPPESQASWIRTMYADIALDPIRHLPLLRKWSEELQEGVEH